MYSRIPTPTFTFIRMHAPCADRFSIRAVTDRSVPALSSHDASTNIITAVRGSCVAPPMPTSIGKIKEHLSGHPPRSPNSEHLFFLICHPEWNGRFFLSFALRERRP